MLGLVLLLPGPEWLQAACGAVDPAWVNGGADGLGPVGLAAGQLEVDGDDGPGPGALPAVAAGGLSPAFLAYVVGLIALVLLLVLRHFGLVAKVPVWAYAGAVGGAQVSGRLVERWPDAPRGRCGFTFGSWCMWPRSRRSSI